MTEKDRLRILFFPEITKKEYSQIKGAINEYNCNSLRSYTLLCGTFMLIMVVISMASDSFAHIFSLYCTFLAGFMTLHILAGLVLKRKPELQIWFVGIFLIMLDVFGGLLGTVYNSEEPIISYIAILLLETVLFIDSTFVFRTISLLSMVIISAFDFYAKDSSLFFDDLVNIWIYGTVGLIAGTYITKLQLKNVISEYRIRVIGNTDVLTNLKNRNCYEERLPEYAKECKESLACIYIDFNGLHELNNTFGHSAGDNALKYVASKLQDAFGEDNTYRIGGDEFIVMIPDEGLEFVENRFSDVRKKVEANNCHISAGVSYKEIASQADFDVKSLISEAEAYMFADKAMYYGSQETERHNVSA